MGQLCKMSPSLRSRRKHKAWGGSPREPFELGGARDSGRKHSSNNARARYHGLKIFIRDCPRAYDPGFTLTPALQAKSWFKTFAHGVDVSDRLFVQTGAGQWVTRLVEFVY